MNPLSPATVLLVLAVSAFTAVAAVMDFRTKRIPNKLTIPMFFAGWAFQLGMSLMYGWHHLLSAFLGFLVGFGLLFLLWFIGGGGGGDVKLMGALSVWLGLKLTLAVLLVSTICVLVATVFVVVSNLVMYGVKKTRDKYLATGKTKAGQPMIVETSEDKLRRRVMAYAGPVAVATWAVVFWNLPRMEQELRADSGQPSVTAETAR